MYHSQKSCTAYLDLFRFGGVHVLNQKAVAFRFTFFDLYPGF